MVLFAVSFKYSRRPLKGATLEAKFHETGKPATA